MVLQAAQSGSSNAQALIGNWHLNGINTPKDIEKALHWLSKASERGNHFATCDLGEMYYHGNGVKKDKEKGVELLKKSADAGVVHAQKKVGLILFKDARTVSEIRIGLQYIIDASNAGNVSARIFISMLAIKHEIKMTPLDGYAMLLHLSREHEEAKKALLEVSHRFTKEEKLEAAQMVEELTRLLKIQNQ